MLKRAGVVFVAGLMAFLSAGCGASIKTYVRPEAPWGAVKRFAVVPFNLPSENPVERQLVTQLFAQELRQAGLRDLIEVPLESPVGTAVLDVRAVGKSYAVDAVFSGSIDITHGTVVHVRLQDVATEDLLWSGTYTLGMRGEFFSFKTHQQHIQRAFERLVDKLKEVRPSAV